MGNRPVISDDTNTLFMIGNKRSGTSFLSKLINLHPKLFVTHESDVLWILYQSRNGMPRFYKRYPFDGGRGMKATIKANKKIINENLTGYPDKKKLVKTFFDIQVNLMRYGSQIQNTYRKWQLLWIGDKKPVQQADPNIWRFHTDLFQNSKYLHIIRHPKSVVASMVGAGRKWRKGVPRYWKSTAEKILERWAIHEQWVLDAKKEKAYDILTIKFEELCMYPVVTILKICDFLNVHCPENMKKEAESSTRKDPNEKYERFVLPDVESAKRIMEIYNYKSEK